MARPTRLVIDPKALLHNLNQIKLKAPGKLIIAMVKANAYGCGIQNVVPILAGNVGGFGVACIEEALNIRSIGVTDPCIVFQGIFSKDEPDLFVNHNLTAVLHTEEQVDWVLERQLSAPLKIWLKVNTGMNRLGFEPEALYKQLARLQNCSWIHRDINLLTHLACAEEVSNPATQQQLDSFNRLDKGAFKQCSIANSAGIIAWPSAHADIIRPGIMLYGVSPFTNGCGLDLNLQPAMRFISALTAIHHIAPHSPVGYGGTWQSDKDAVVGIVAAGYGDGYPRHITAGTPVWINGYQAPIIGHVSMDTLSIDLTNLPPMQIGERVELWGMHIPVEKIALLAKTSPYELICQVGERIRKGIDNTCY